MSKFDSPVTELLYLLTLDGTAETVGDCPTFGSIHHGLGRVTRAELDANFSRQLNETGITSHDILDGLFWIVDEDDQGFVGATPFSTEQEYRAAMDELEDRCAKFYAEPSR